MTGDGVATVDRRCEIWGAPFDGAATLGWPGSRYAPGRIRHQLGWMLQRRERGQIYCLDDGEVHDFPDDLIVDRGDADTVAHDVDDTLNRVATAVSDTASRRRVPVLLGGDDSLLYSTVRGVAEATEDTVAVVHFDAHLDLLDESHQQGKWSHSSGMRRSLELDNVDPARCVQVASRHFNFPSSLQVREQHKLKNIPAAEVHRAGVGKVVEQILDQVAGASRVVLCFDIDSVDPAHAPGAGAHEPGGLTSHQALESIRLLAPHCDGLCVTEVNPLLDVADRTANLAAYLVVHFAVHSQ